MIENKYFYYIPEKQETEDDARDFAKKRIEPDFKNGGKEWE